jgi:hypothetical protein
MVFLVLLSFVLSWSQNPPTLLVVVRDSDDSFWKMTCYEKGAVNSQVFPACFAINPL